MITADLADESAMRAAFAETGADAQRPPAGVVLFVGTGPTDLTEAVTRARDSVWSVASTVRAIVGRLARPAHRGCGWSPGRVSSSTATDREIRRPAP